jgi:hypothetical protein
VHVVGALATALILSTPGSLPVGRSSERATTPAEATDPACLLLLPGSDGLPSEQCAACHDAAGHGNSHPVAIDYQAAQAAPRSGLRSMEEAVRRGALFVEGRVECTSCHDRRSPWRHHLAILPGADVRPAVDRRAPATFEQDAAVPLPPGSDVGRKPLCLTCHALD